EGHQPWFSEGGANSAWLVSYVTVMSAKTGMAVNSTLATKACFIDGLPGEKGKFTSILGEEQGFYSQIVLVPVGCSTAERVIRKQQTALLLDTLRPPAS